MHYVCTFSGAKAIPIATTSVSRQICVPVSRDNNAGGVPHTSKFTPWELKTYVAFSDEQQAIAFEKYLKSASGRAFAKKRL